MIKKLFAFVLLIATVSSHTIAQHKLQINEKSKHQSDWQFKSQFIGTTEEHAFYLAKEKDNLMFFKLDKEGNIFNKVPIILHESEKMKTPSLSDFLLLNDQPFVVFQAYTVSDKTWRSYVQGLGDDGILSDKEALVIDESTKKYSTYDTYRSPNINTNSDQNEAAMVTSFETDKDNKNKWTRKYNIYDAEMKLIKESIIRGVDKEGVYSLDKSNAYYDNRKMANFNFTTLNKKNQYAYTYNAPDLVIEVEVQNLDDEKIYSLKVPVTGGKAISSILHTKNKLILTGVTLEGEKKYAKQQFVVIYDYVTDKIVTKTFPFPADAFSKLEIKDKKAGTLTYGDDFFVARQASASRDNGNYMVALKVYKLKNGVEDESAIQLVQFDSTLTSIKAKMTDIKNNALSRYVVSENNILSYTIEKNETDGGKKDIVQTSIDNEGAIKKTVVFTYDWRVGAPLMDSYGVIRNRVVIIEIKKDGEGYFATLDID